MVHERREVALLFVVEFWCIHGNLTSEVEVYIPLFTCFFGFFCSEKGRVKILMLFIHKASGSVFQGVGTSTIGSTEMMFRPFIGIAGGPLAGHYLTLFEGQSNLPGVCFC